MSKLIQDISGTYIDPLSVHIVTTIMGDMGAAVQVVVASGQSVLLPIQGSETPEQAVKRVAMWINASRPA